MSEIMGGEYMNLDEKVDIKENKIYKLDSYLLSILLFDRMERRYESNL